jgi:hypothetical protein
MLANREYALDAIDLHAQDMLGGTPNMCTRYMICSLTHYSFRSSTNKSNVHRMCLTR